MGPKISVIIPVYNKEKYIDQCVKSILNQTMGDFEIFLIDDGSTDSSLAKCNDWALRDNRISVIHKVNEGPALARNLGLDKAMGEIVSFVDADDYLDPETYHICCEEMAASGADACYFGRRVVTDGKIVNDTVRIPEKLIYNKNLIKTEFIKYMLGAMPEDNVRSYVGVSTCTVVYLRNTIEKNHIRFVDVKQNEDPIFNIILCNYASKIVVLPDILYNNTVGFESLTRRYDSERFEVFKQGYLETIKFAADFPDCDHVQYRMDFKFINNVCRVIQLEMRFAKTNGFFTALKHIRLVCRDDLVQRVVSGIILPGNASKRMTLFKLIRRRQAFIIWLYHIKKDYLPRWIRMIKNKFLKVTKGKAGRR